MLTRLWIAFKQWGESEGKPFLATQALGIPVVALVFLTIRAQMHNHVAFNILLASDPPDWSFIVAGLIVIVYAADFISDAISWDGIGVKFVSWQLILAVGWILLGSFIVLTLTLVLPLFGFGARDGMGFLDLLWSLRDLILGGLLYCYLKWRGGAWLAFLGPVLIAFVFDCAVFRGLPSDGLILFWIQGFCVFLLNVLLMQFFEKDKDAVSNTPNLWILYSGKMLRMSVGSIFLLTIIFWVINDLNGDVFDGVPFGTILLLAVYGWMFIFPSAFKLFRWYRVLIDGMLVFWLI